MKKIIKNYKRDGYVVLKNFFKKKDILDAKKEIFYCSQKLYKKKIKKINFNPKHFDYYLSDSLKSGKKFSSDFYNLSKKFSSMHKLAFNKKLVSTAKKLLNTKNVGILNRAYGYRIDRPRDKRYLTQLHQDYIQNLGAPEGLVFYNSLRKVTPIDGPVCVYKGSHKLGLLNTKVKQKSVDKSHSYLLKISESRLKKFKKIFIKINETDLAIFDFFLLHKSTPNLSKNIRWSMISRFFNFDSKIGIKNFFPGGIQEFNKFEDFHPEKISK